MGLPHPATNKLEAHNCWLVCTLSNIILRAGTNEIKADVVKDYIGWAIGKGYAVIDVNIPKFVTNQSVSIEGYTIAPFPEADILGFSQSVGKYENEDENRPSATEELAGYLWDNYIEYVDWQVLIGRC